MSFARIDATLKSAIATRINPLAGGKFGDNVDAKGHTFDEHGGVDIYGGDGSRTVRAPTALEIIRAVDARKEDPNKTRGAAGPFWVDAYELDSRGSTTGSVLRFLHLESVEPAVKAGARIEQSQTLGKYWAKTFKGNEGHLHFEVRTKSGTSGYGEVRNPIEWLRGSEERKIVRIVSMLNQTSVYSTLKIGDTLYAQSGQQLKIDELSGYPWIQATSIDSGNVSGEVTNDIGEAADWVLDVAKKEAEYNWKKDGLTGFKQWGDKIGWGNPLGDDKPIKKQLEEAAELPPADRYVKAWQLRKELDRLRKLSFVEQTKQSAKDDAKVYVKTVGKAAAAVGDTAMGVSKAVLGSVWDSIPSEVKLGAAVLGGVALVAALSNVRGKD